MGRIELASQFVDDMDRIASRLERYEVPGIETRMRGILEALDVLGANPLMGRPTHVADLRELVLGRRSRGYVALYAYAAAIDTVFVLSVRAQREGGYARDE